MKTLCNCLLLMLITSALAYGQRHQILKESLSLEEGNSVIFNIENIYVAIEESTDDYIHFDYMLEFDGYSKKEIKEKLNELKAEVSRSDKGVTLLAKSESTITFETFRYKEDYGITMVDDFFGSGSDSIFRKSKESLLKTIRKNNKVEWSKNPYEHLNKTIRRIDKDGNVSKINKDNIDLMRSHFVIKVPPNVSITLVGKNSGFYVRSDLQNKFSADLKSGTLKTKALNNPENTIRLEDASFEAEALLDGDYILKNAMSCKIGSIENSKIQSEFSKIEIGEIRKDNNIMDFNSDYRIYNWDLDVSKTTMVTEYSKLNIFLPQNTEYFFQTFGHSTVHYWGNIITEIPPSRQNKSSKMMAIGDEKNAKNKIYIQTTHGIIRIGEEVIPK